MNKSFVPFILVLVVLTGFVLVYNSFPVPEMPSGYTVPVGKSAVPQKSPRKTVRGISLIKAAPPATAKNAARVVFTIADAAAPIENIKSVLVTLSEIDIHSPTRGWIIVNKTPATYDLLKLYRDSSTLILSDLQLEAVSYDQIRFVIDSVSVVTTDGNARAAVLPSNELKINTALSLYRGDNAEAGIDFLVNKSLHITGDGQYLFMPVVRFETRGSVSQLHLLTDKKIDVVGGVTQFDAMFGMNEEGALKTDFSFSTFYSFRVVNGAIQVIAPGESAQKISADAALAFALKSGAIDTALSVKLGEHFAKPAWRIAGKRAGATVVVYIDPVLSTIVGIE